jgi:hypothetical protein
MLELMPQKQDVREEEAFPPRRCRCDFEEGMWCCGSFSHLFRGREGFFV